MLLLAHRGLTSAGNPENTAEAVAAARRAGADGCEVDLRLAADGVLLTSHDDDLLRTAGRPETISGTASSRLRGIALPGGTRLARLAEVVEANDGGRLVLELKRPPSGPPQRTALALAGELRSLRRAGRDLDVTVSSFSASLVGAVRALGLPVRTALLGDRGVDPLLVLAQARYAGHEEVHPHVEALVAAPETVAQAGGVAVVPWTVNRPDDADGFAALGVPAVITDVPLLLRARRPDYART